MWSINWYESQLGEKIVILKQLRTVSVIAEKCYQILYLLLSPSYFYKILKAYSTLYWVSYSTLCTSILINKPRNTFQLSLISLKHISPPRLFRFRIRSFCPKNYYLIQLTVMWRFSKIRKGRSSMMRPRKIDLQQVSVQFLVKLFKESTNFSTGEIRAR